MEIINQNTFKIKSVEGTNNHTIKFHVREKRGLETTTVQDGIKPTDLLNVLSEHYSKNKSIKEKIDVIIEEIKGKKEPQKPVKKENNKSIDRL